MQTFLTSENIKEPYILEATSSKKLLPYYFSLIYSGIADQWSFQNPLTLRTKNVISFQGFGAVDSRSQTWTFAHLYFCIF